MFASRFARIFARPRAYLSAHRRQVMASGVDFLGQAAIYGCIGSVLGTHVIASIDSEGPSMLPTLSERGDRLFAEKLTAPGSGAWASRIVRQLFGWQIRVGDVVWCKSTRDPKTTVVKRVIALGGEEVPVPVNDMFGERVIMKEVPSGYLWLQGDNLADSTDSREYGPVPQALVQGKVLFKVNLPQFHAFKWSNCWRAFSFVSNSHAFKQTGGFALQTKLAEQQRLAAAATATATAADSTTVALTASAPAHTPAHTPAPAPAPAPVTPEPVSTAGGAIEWTTNAVLNTVNRTRVAFAQRTDTPPAGASAGATASANSPVRAPAATATPAERLNRSRNLNRPRNVPRVVDC